MMLTSRMIPKILTVLVFAALIAFPAMAQEDPKQGRGESFATPTFREMALTSLLLGAYDTNSNETIDEYAKLMYCPLYQEKFKSDFEWNSVRQELGRKLQSKREYFRTHYEIAGTLFLGRYSFETQDFPFVNNTALVNVGSLSLISASPTEAGRFRVCGEPAPSTLFPSNYLFMLNQPLTLDRLKMPMDEAEALLKRFEVMNNKQRAIYIRFRVRLLGAGPLYTRGARTSMMMRGDLVSIDLFYDREMTKHFAVVSLK
jgi:hypothetical protein